MTALLAAPAAASAGTGYAPLAGRGKPIRTKVRTDGLLTVGGQETITLKGVPPRPHERLRASITPPITAQNCFAEPPIEFGFFSACLPQPLHPVAGTPALKRNKKGRASMTFVMPAAYEYIDFNDPTQSHPVYLVDNQTVAVEIVLVFRPGPRSVEADSLAYTSAVVEVPPPPPAVP